MSETALKSIAAATAFFVGYVLLQRWIRQQLWKREVKRAWQRGIDRAREDK